MKEKIKEFSKKYLIGFILGLITTLSISVIAATYFPSGDVTYDNTESGLESTNVQGAIDELYGVCFPSAGDQIIEDNGLEKDPYECRYFFKGANPNNYITFNDEDWRIISVECDGTIKIVRDVVIENIMWDTYGSNNWARPAALNSYLNSTYLNSLNSASKRQIISHDFSIGGVTRNNNDLAGQVNDENNKTWNGKIALPTASEYLRTNSNSNCKTLSSNNGNYETCKNTTWMYVINIDYWWTLSASASDIDDVFFVTNYGAVFNNYPYYTGSAARPTLYLSSEVQITGGDGSQSNPYTLG